MKILNALRIILFVLIFSTCVSAQFYGGSRYSGIGLPFFDIQVYRTFNIDKATPQINIYLEMLYDDLTFIKNDSLNRFDAKFEIVAAVFDEDENQIAARVLTNDVSVEDYKKTNSRSERIQLNRAMEMVSGNYILKVRVTDLISGQTLSLNENFDLFDTSEEDIAMSDLIFLNDLELDAVGNIVSVKPRVRDNFSRESDKFYVYFDVYSKIVPAEITTRYQFLTTEGESEIDTTVISRITKPVTSQIFKVRKSSLKGNAYRCVVEVDNGEDDVEASKGLSFYWITSPETDEDLSLALKQMRYMGIEDSIDKYEDAPYEEQKEYFDRYWREHDPNPNTAINELMVAYYERVNFANREFSNFSEGGWLSDRGRILIKFGQPDDIERHPFEVDSHPYEVWRYYARRKTLLFWDRSGFGDYRIHPDYLHVEYEW